MARQTKTHGRGTIEGDRTQLLRALPPLDECLAAAEHDQSLAHYGRDYLKLVLRRVQGVMREAIIGGTVVSQQSRDHLLAEIVDRARRFTAADEPALKPVINATGVVLHTNLGRALMAESALEAVAQAASSPVNIEFNLETGERGDRDHIVEDELRALTGAEGATVVNNNAAAVLLVLNTLAEGREVIVSRGELIEIGGSFRIPDVMARSGARLREVGTTNRTHDRDYSSAIGPETALLMKIHPSNYRIVGFTAEVELGQLVEIGRAHNLDVVEDLGAGALIDMSAYGLPREPVVRERIAAGAALVTFSGDKLLGGPQAGIIVGRQALIERLKANPLKRALRCDKLTLAALEATLRLYLRGRDLSAELPVLRMLRRSAAEIQVACAHACDILAERLGAGFRLEVVESTSEIGSGSLPTQELETRVIRVTHSSKSAAEIATMFRAARPAVIGRVQNGAFLLDLRTVEDPALLAVEFH